jgi:hypothetical protein
MKHRFFSIRDKQKDKRWHEQLFLTNKRAFDNEQLHSCFSSLVGGLERDPAFMVTFTFP